MNEVERLFKNINILIECGTLDSESETLAYEYPDLNDIRELNEIIEDEITTYADV